MPKKKPPKYLQCSKCKLLAEYDGGSGLYFTKKDGEQLSDDISCPKGGKHSTRYPSLKG